MNLCHFCIKRPVFSVVLSLILILFGWVGFENLEIRYFPKVTIYKITIQYNLSGATAEYMSNNVTRYVEGALQNVDGIKDITSTSSLGRSSTTVELESSINLIKAMADIRTAVNTIDPGDLPDDIKQPTISLSDTGNRGLIIGFTF